MKDINKEYMILKFAMTSIATKHIHNYADEKENQT